MYSNVDSLLNKKSELEARIAITTPDVIALVEIYPKNLVIPVDDSELQIKGYNMLLSSKSHRGVVLYCKKNLQCRQVNFQDNDFVESVWCEIVAGPEHILFGCLYRSPNSTDLNNAALLKLMWEVDKSPYTNLFMVGDFNLPNINWEIPSVAGSGSSFASDFLDTLQNLFLSQVVEEPTRMREGQKSNTLDLIITNQEEMLDYVAISSPVGKSDHMVLDFRLIMPGTIHHVSEIKRFAFFKGDYEGMKKYVKENGIFHSMVTETEDRDLNTVNNTFIHCIEELTSKFVPKVKVRDSHQPQWMSSDVRQAINSKHKAWNHFQKTRSPQDRKSFNKLRNEATAKVTEAKKTFERKLTSEIKTNPKSFWSYVQSKNKFKQGIGDLEKPDGNLAETDEDKAETLNAFFASVFTKEDVTCIPTCEPRVHDKCLDTVIFTTEKVKKAILKLDQSKSPGPDNVHNRVLKELVDDISQPLASLFTKSMSKGEVPDSWNEANVTPIFKKGDKKKPGNYRPVSLTSTLSKLMETIIRDEIVNYLNTNSLFVNNQYGFRKGRSCESQLLDVLEEWTKELDNKGSVDCIYLDYSKAFDSVPHKRLQIKLEAHGITGNLLKWIVSFLSGRTQQVVVNGVPSKIHNIYIALNTMFLSAVRKEE